MTRPISSIVYSYVSTTVMDGSFSHASRTNNLFKFEYVVIVMRVRPLDVTTYKKWRRHRAFIAIFAHSRFHKLEFPLTLYLHVVVLIIYGLISDIPYL
jgi:hypothetical protein